MMKNLTTTTTTTKMNRTKYLDRIKKLHEAYDEQIGKILLTRGHRHPNKQREYEIANTQVKQIEEALKDIAIECFGKLDKYGLPIVDIPEENCKYYYTLSNTNGKTKEVTKEFYYKELIPREAHNYLFHGGDNHNPHKTINEA
jgi:hypothetical protein